MTDQSNVRQLDYAIPIPDNLDKNWLLKTPEGLICLLSLTPMMSVWLVYILEIPVIGFRLNNLGPPLRQLESFCVYYNLIYWPFFFLVHMWPWKNPIRTIVYSKTAGRILTELIICNLLQICSFEKYWGFSDPYMQYSWITIGVFCWFVVRQYFPTWHRYKIAFGIFVCWILLFEPKIHAGYFTKFTIFGVQFSPGETPCENHRHFITWWQKISGY